LCPNLARGILMCPLFSVSCCCVCVTQADQSVRCLATGWTTGRSRFDPRQRRKNLSSRLCVQTGSATHPTSCTMGTGVLSPGLKRGRGVTLTTHPHLAPRSMSRSYISSPTSAFMACSGTALALAAVCRWSLSDHPLSPRSCIKMAKE
jgi:hypothetical protein